MEGFPLFWILIFVVITVLEGIGRKRQSQQKGRPQTGPRPDQPSTGHRPPPPEPSTSAGGRTAQEGGPATSEGMLPKEVWEEILGLARGPEFYDVPQPAGIHDALDRSGLCVCHRCVLDPAIRYDELV